MMKFDQVEKSPMNQHISINIEYTYYGAKYIWYEMVSDYGTKWQFCGTKW